MCRLKLWMECRDIGTDAVSFIENSSTLAGSHSEGVAATKTLMGVSISGYESGKFRVELEGRSHLWGGRLLVFDGFADW